MTRSTRTRLVAAACSVAACLIAAPAASAGTIRYTIEPSPAYTIQDNGNGIVKVTYNGCVTAGERQTLLFDLATSVSGDATAIFNILKEEGDTPTATFTPPSVPLQKGVDQTFDVALSFGLEQANNDRTTFRIKLDPESGEGLGQGAGILVSIPCVLAAPPAQSAPAGTAPAGAAPGDAPGPLTAPTLGQFPTVLGAQAKAPSACVAVAKRLRLRAGETTNVRVTVITNGQRISGARVRATYPGAVQIKRSDATGVVNFRVRPRRAGQLIVQSDVCFGADRVSVLGARAVAGARPGRYTG